MERNFSINNYYIPYLLAGLYNENKFNKLIINYIKNQHKEQSGGVSPELSIVYLKEKIGKTNG